jgi:toxin-antitoxin system PIN domain toxin
MTAVLLDANILIGAFRPDAPQHEQLKAWLEENLRAGQVVTFPALVEVAFLRIVTHLRIFRPPSRLEEAIGFLQAIHASGRFREAAWTLRARERWWQSCQDLDIHGDDVNDAYLAATAAEARCPLVSRDRGFARFRGLDWRNPVQMP